MSSGALIASGQINNMGYRAYVIVWDWSSKKELFRHEMHRGRVQALCFTSNELCLISLGGCDDGMLIVWDVQKKCVRAVDCVCLVLTGGRTYF